MQPNEPRFINTLLYFGRSKQLEVFATTEGNVYIKALNSKLQLQEIELSLDECSQFIGLLNKTLKHSKEVCSILEKAEARAERQKILLISKLESEMLIKKHKLGISINKARKESYPSNVVQSPKKDSISSERFTTILE